jgi:hypothetical protein
MSAFWLAAVALAQEAPPPTESSDQPLAIPQGDAPPPPARRQPRRGPSDEAFRSQALTIRNVSEFYGTPGTVTTWGWGWGHVGVWTPPGIVREDDWAVFRGPVRLDVPGFLEITGDLPARMMLERRIQNARSASTALYATAVGGGIATVGGIIGMGDARTVQDYALWSQVTTVGVVALIGGAVGGSFPAARARRLATHPSETLTYDDALKRVEDYNANLRNRLAE